ncbi:MAG: urease accessory protein [Methylophagaceae bacterium]
MNSLKSANPIKDPSPSAWEAQLDLTFAARPDKTVLSQRQQRGPLAVQRAFYPEGDVCHLYILHPPGGVVGGDKLSINVTVEQQAKALLTTPGATKFYKSQGYYAYQHQNIQLDEMASLEWLPQENIYFPGAQVQMRTQINLMETARFIGWETHCLGLPANKLQFKAGQVKLDLAIYRGGRPIVLERIKIDYERLMSPTGLRGNSVMAMLVASPADSEMLDLVRRVLSDYAELLIAATLIENCLLIRYLGGSTAQSKQVFTKLWMSLRPMILERDACTPRIWST